MSNDWYSDFVNSGFGKQVAGTVGLPPVPRLRRHEPGQPLLSGPALLGTATSDGRLTKTVRTLLADAGVEVHDDPAAPVGGGSSSSKVAAAIVERLAHEIVTLARVALERLDLLGERVEVVLGGGVLAAGNPVLLDAVESGLRALSAELEPRLAAAPPIVGAALLALDEAGTALAAVGRDPGIAVVTCS